LKRYEIRIAGFGGQGVITVGKILGVAAALHDKKNAVQTQSYGPESRGGACKSEIVLSDGEIHYPKVRSADVLVALSQTALDVYLKVGNKKFQNMVALGALCQLTGAVSSQALEIAIGESVPPKTLAQNLEAFQKGIEYVR
jgi:2-oxoglutarate ferredoxin oxidoreductase subunit gamma